MNFGVELFAVGLVTVCTQAVFPGISMISKSCLCNALGDLKIRGFPEESGTLKTLQTFVVLCQTEEVLTLLKGCKATCCEARNGSEIVKNKRKLKNNTNVFEVSEEEPDDRTAGVT